MLRFAYVWVFALLPAPLLARWLLPQYLEPRAAVRLPVFVTLEMLTGRTAGAGAAVRQRTIVQVLLYVVAWIALVAALARPQWLESPIVRQVPTRDLLLAVDLSGSMEAADFQSASGATVDRLTAVKEVLDEFLTRRDGDRVGLVVFGNAAFVQVPFTQDLNVTRQLMNDLQPRMAGPKTAFGDAIGLAIGLFDDSEVEQRVLIALTDGNDTGSRIPPLEAARIAADNGITIHTVAIGDPATAGEDALDEAALREVAEVSGGKYYFAGDRASLEAIYDDIDQLEPRVVETVSHRPVRDLFQWPLGVALAIVLGFHFGWSIRVQCCGRTGGAASSTDPGGMGSV